MTHPLAVFIALVFGVILCYSTYQAWAESVQVTANVEPTAQNQPAPPNIVTKNDCANSGLMFKTSFAQAEGQGCTVFHNIVSGIKDQLVAVWSAYVVVGLMMISFFLGEQQGLHWLSLRRLLMR